jgi:hypothetical protein
MENNEQIASAKKDFETETSTKISEKTLINCKMNKILIKNYIRFFV